MRVCKIWDADYPWDIRVDKVASSLTESGHSVDLVCRNVGRLPEYDEIDGMRVHRLPIVGGRWNRLVSFPAFFNPVWIRRIGEVVERQRSDVILVRDLPLAPTAIWLGRRVGVPVVFDMAEDYGAMIRDIWRFEGFRLHNVLVRNPRAIDRVERYCVRRSDAVLTVVEESRDRLLRRYGLPPGKVHVVSNTPRMEDVWSESVPEAVDDWGKGTLRLVYVGGLQAARTLDVILAGMARVAERLACTLRILGKGHTESELRCRVDELGLADSVRFEGFVEYRQMGKFLRGSHAGLIPHPATEHTNTTVPNKLFEYMAHGLALLASDSAPVKRIVESEECGHVYTFDDVDDFLAKLQPLSDPATRRSMGRRAEEAVNRRYNWGVDGTRLVSVLEACVELHAAK